MLGIAGGNYSSALDQLQNDILLKTDGCAKDGAPDKNGWINTLSGAGADVYVGG